MPSRGFFVKLRDRDIEWRVSASQRLYEGRGHKKRESHMEWYPASTPSCLTLGDELATLELDDPCRPRARPQSRRSPAFNRNVGSRGMTRDGLKRAALNTRGKFYDLVRIPRPRESQPTLG
jgi:hypothetical protein